MRMSDWSSDVCSSDLNSNQQSRDRAEFSRQFLRETQSGSGQHTDYSDDECTDNQQSGNGRALYNSARILLLINHVKRRHDGARRPRRTINGYAQRYDEAKSLLFTSGGREIDQLLINQASRVGGNQINDYLEMVRHQGRIRDQTIGHDKRAQQRHEGAKGVENYPS